MVHVQYPALVVCQTCDFAVAHVRGPGILRRVRRGRGFSYRSRTTTSVTDAATLQRIKDLVIPPAWKKVWICSYPNGHIRRSDTDAAGRRQYLYHQKWQDERNEEKFDRVLEMSAALPDMRRRIAADLRRHGLERDRVLALALHLLDLGYFRAGSEQYAEENNSYGIATLAVRTRWRCSRQAVEFDYPAKSGVRRTLLIDDPEVVRSVRALLRGRGRTEPTPGVPQRLRLDRPSRRRPQRAASRTRRRRVHGQDLRTWHGTVLGAAAFVDADPPANKTVIKRVESAVMKEVAEELGNTPAVARSSYVDPRVVEGYESGLTIAAGVRRSRAPESPANGRRSWRAAPRG